jgi:hypothetical protein
MFATAVFAVFVMAFATAWDVSPWRSIGGIGLVWVLVVGKIAYDKRNVRKSILRERDEGEKRPD